MIKHENNTVNLSGISVIRENKRDITLKVQDSLRTFSPPSYNPENATYQVIDFFSGCGGMTLGFSVASSVYPFFRILGGLDIDPDAAATYEANFGVPCITQDIRELLKKDEFDKFLSELNFDPQKPVIIIGCPPCQGFTSHRKKNWENDDDRNSLVGIFAEIAVRLSPACIVMENVPEMLSHKYWHHFEIAQRIFTTAGYQMHQTIYSAASFGVPQERFRAIVIAMKHNFLLPEPIISDPKSYTTVRQAIGHLQPVSPGQFTEDKMHRSASHKESTINTIRAVPKDGGSRPFGVGPKCLDKIKGFSDVYGRLYWDRPAITITHYARNPASGRFVHPEQDRGLTMREAAILQSFPTGFEFCGTFDPIFKQIGEAVPPMFACGIATSIAVEVLAPPPTPEEIEGSVPSVMKPVNNSYSSVIAGIKNYRRQP